MLNANLLTCEFLFSEVTNGMCVNVTAKIGYLDKGVFSPQIEQIRSETGPLLTRKQFEMILFRQPHIYRSKNVMLAKSGE